MIINKVKFLRAISIYLLICTLWCINETGVAATICQIFIPCFLNSRLFFISMYIFFLNHTLR